MRELVLVGGGHAHVQVLRRWMMRPLPGVRLTLIVDRPAAVYSGMVPGFVAGDYTARELEIDGVPLARRARARVVLAAATRIDAAQRRVELEGRPPLRFDVASLDVGSTVRGLDQPGVREHALATRPIRGFVDALDARVAQALEQAAGRPLRLAIAGGGAAGVELAFTLQARLAAAGSASEITLYTRDAGWVAGYPARVARRFARLARERGIALRAGVEVEAVGKDAIRVEGERAACDLAVWATGAAPPALLAASDLPLDDAGFVRVDRTLAVEGTTGLFAAGDCASLGWAPWVRKAGVYAVREGPVLDRNLRASLTGARPRRYRPQRDFLSLLHLGEGRAFGAKWGLAAEGRTVWRLKDAIDRRFMRRFTVLTGAGGDARDFPSPESMGMEEMECGGCAAKLAPDPLAAALARLEPAAADASVVVGLSHADDAAALRTSSGDVVLATVDGFRAFADDPWLVGRVAAVNALSDVHAKGGRPRHALAWVGVNETEPAAAGETLYQVLSGVRAALDPLGVSLVGGHTTSGEELHVGLAILGELDDGAWLGLDGLRPGDALVLSGPLGTGVVLAADMQGRLAGEQLLACHAAMLRPGAAASRLAREHGARAATDVSGFGLARHLDEMLVASGLAAVLDADALPALPGALELLSRGLRSSYHEQNAAARGLLRAAPGDPHAELLFDPQTSGPLLIGVEARRADALVRDLRAAGDAHAARIGRVAAPCADGARIVLERSGR